jgi:hypothetical protein
VCLLTLLLLLLLLEPICASEQTELPAPAAATVDLHVDAIYLCHPCKHVLLIIKRCKTPFELPIKAANAYHHVSWLCHENTSIMVG